MVSGDTGASKSIWRDAIVAAGLRGEKFLGRDVAATRFMVIDGENPRSIVHARMRALGINNEHWPRLHYTGRDKGVLLGRAEWDEWLRHEAESFRPDVIFIDSVAKCCAVALLDNDSVIALYRDVLVPLVSEFDCGLVLALHERKGRGGGTGDRSQDAMGARQWVDQADAQITLAATGKFQQTPDGETRRPFAMRTPKHRWAAEDQAEHYVITGRVREDQTPIKLTIQHPQAEPTNDEKLVAAVGEDRLGRSALAEAVGLHVKGTAFRNALTRCLGRWPSDAGRGRALRARRVGVLECCGECCGECCPTLANTPTRKIPATRPFLRVLFWIPLDIQAPTLGIVQCVVGEPSGAAPTTTHALVRLRPQHEIRECCRWPAGRLAAMAAPAGTTRYSLDSIDGEVLVKPTVDIASVREQAEHHRRTTTVVINSWITTESGEIVRGGREVVPQRP